MLTCHVTSSLGTGRTVASHFGLTYISAPMAHCFDCLLSDAISYRDYLLMFLIVKLVDKVKEK
jgi:hypothetical protein